MEIRRTGQRRIPALICLHRHVDRQPGSGLVRRQFCHRQAQERSNAHARPKVGDPEKARVRCPCGQQQQTRQRDSNPSRPLQKMKRGKSSQRRSRRPNRWFTETHCWRFEKPKNQAAHRRREKPEPVRKRFPISACDSNDSRHNARQRKKKWNQESFSLSH